MNTILKRLVSLLLCFVLVAGYLPAGAFAAETEEAVTAETTAVTEEPTQVASEETEAPSESKEESTEQSEQADASAKEEKKSEKEAKKEAKQEKTVSAEETSGVLTASAEAAAISVEATEATEPEVIAVTGITLDQTELEVSVGELPMTLTATVLPENATDKTVTWESSEPGVASVEDGVLTFGYMGKAVITATAGEFSASCTVTVDEGEWSGYSNDEIDYLFVATDRHTNTSVIGNIINNMESAIDDNELDYLALGGDMVGSGNSHPSYNSSTVLGEVTGATSSLDKTNVDIVAGIHDMNVNDDADIVLPYQGGGAQIYEGDRFYVYGVEEYCISEDSNESNWSSEAQEFVTWANGSDIDKSKVIIVVSHYPLHAKRGDNVGAGYWHNALNTVATGSATGTEVVRNVVFFHGHNHTVDSNEYCYAPGSTMSIESYVEPSGVAAAADPEIMSVYDDEIETYATASGTNATIYYTYATAGYLNQNSKATLVTITDEKISLTKYSTSGSGTAMTSVDRVAEAVTLSSVAISGTTSYTVGDALALTVTATYSDGTTADVTADATITGYDMSAAGTYTVTATYEGETATIEITVKSAEPTVNTVDCWDDTEQVYVKATGLGLTEVTATNMYGTNDAFAEMFTDHMAVDIALTGLVEGESAAYSISVVPDLDITNLELYYVEEDGTLTPVEFELVTDELNNVYVEFTTDKVGTFVYGSPNVPEGYVLTSLILANIPTDVFLGGSLVLDETAEITATYTMEGAEDFVRKLTIYDYDYTNFSGFDVNVAGKQTVTFTFEGVTATHEIFVWGDSVSDEASGITVALDAAGAEYGVTAVNVAESVNEYVTDAVAAVMSNYVAYDISLVYEDGYAATEDTKTVTLPIPEGVENPVVYYVSDSGKSVVDMKAEKTEDGKSVTFTTTHFSTYVVGEGTEIEVPENETAEGENTVAGSKTIYKLVSSLTSGEEYLIVSSNRAGSAYGLAGNTTGASVTIKAADDVSSDVYIEDKGSALEWTAASGWSFTSGSYDLGYSNGLSFSTEDEWTFNSNRLYQSVRSGRNTNTYYLRCNSSGTWSASTSSSNVYFYQKTVVDSTTTVSGTWSIEGTDETVAAVPNSTFDLNSILKFTTDDGVTTPEMDPAKLSYSIVTEDKDGNAISGDPLGVISGIDENGTVTLSGKSGKALVKVSYESDFGTVTDYITVTATTPDHFSIQLHEVELTVAEGVTADNFNSGKYYTYDSTTGFYIEAEAYAEGTTYYTLPVILGDEITAPIALKGIEAGESYAVWAVVKAYATAEDTEGVDVGTLGDSLSWTVSDESIATINEDTGVITFTGTNYGTFTVNVAYEGANGQVVTDTITISATESLYTVPDDGTNDFPEYPNEGAVRFDKTATALGNYSETGIAKVELSMTGVPYSTGSELDVVLMLDMTGSMSDDAMKAAEEAAVAFVAQIVKNEDGTYNDNRVAVYAFNSGSSSPYELVALGTIDSDTELEAANTAIRTASDKQVSGGTPYDEALAKCQSVLAAAKTTNLPEGVESADDYNRQQFCVFMSDGGPTSFEYITNYDAVKAGTASQYTTATASATGGANQSDSNFATIATYTHEYYSTLMKDDGVTMFSVLTGLSADDYPNCATILENIASSSGNAYVVPDGDDTSAVSGALSSIAQKIVEAAKDVVVEDKIGNNYTLNFKLPTNVTTEEAGMSEFYIQVLEYQLDSDKERTGTPAVLENFTFDANGAIKSHTVNGTVTCEGTACTHVTFTTGRVTKIDGTYFTYTCAPKLDANGNEVKNEVGDTITEEYLTWKADKLTTTELVLEYFAYLDNSAGFDADHQVPAGTYYTNEYATLTYTNYKGNRVQQEFPIPQMTWNGAQVTYVFYLVNEAGQPVNRAGRVVPFAESVYVTDPVTFNVTWNEQTGTENILAHDIFATAGVPEVYELYDDAAQYVIRVYQTENVDTNGKNGNYFQISGSDDKQIDSALDSDTTVNNSTTVVFNTKAGKKYDAYGSYSIYEVGTSLTNGTTDITTTVKADDIDYANTTVAFAVVWKPELVEDAVVVDYGLDVVIDVIKNDNMAAGVVGVRADAPANVEQNKGEYTSAKATSVAVYIDSNNDGETLKENKIGTATVENLNQVRFSLDKDNGMQFTDPAVFYYEADVNFYNSNNVLQTTSMYSSVTVIPATTIYYEDSFIDLTVWSYDDAETPLDDEWYTVGTTTSATQDQDRPGESQISGSIDADNVYGYDGAYKNCSTYSMGSARKVTVDDNKYAEAQFTFYGTGFDVISLTSNTTGTITVDVYNGTNVTYSDDNREKSIVVDTFYGYKQNDDGTWEVDSESTDALYQVPVMKVEGLEYGQYTVVITAAYYSGFDHTDAGSYDFYLDAIRIYDPTGNMDDVANDAYVDDGEGWPTYFEVRNEIIDQATANQIGTEGVEGIVFIDGVPENASVSDYTSYGPNNETYLAAGQAIAFDLNATATAGDIAKVQLAAKTVGGNASIKVYSTDGTTALDADITTATDMYYDITALNGKTVIIINDGESGILSITNVKVTYTEAQPEASDPAPAMFMLRRSSVDEALATLNVEEEEIPETTVPEESVPETTVPVETEPEETEPEVTEPEATEPSETPSAEEMVQAITNVVKDVVNKVVNALSNLFGRWLR